MLDKIIIKGAKENNLKNVSLEIPKNELIVFTGVSGSGKSSLAFDTIFAEGQRRYVESLSVYARQFLGQLDKPDVEYIDGLSPAISIGAMIAEYISISDFSKPRVLRFTFSFVERIESNLSFKSGSMKPPTSSTRLRQVILILVFMTVVM